jgi:hypothetical protein
MKKTLLLAAALATASMGLRAQPDPLCPAVVDITSVQTINDQVEVYIRPDNYFDGFFAALVFTVRWFDGEANLGSTQQVISQLDYFGSITKSGPEQVDGPFRYQIYAGFGVGTLADAGESWTAGEEILLCRLNIINGNSAFTVVNDGFTAANNGDFFVSLNGRQCFGEPYTFTTGVDELPGGDGPMVIPNPNDGRFELVFPSDLEGDADLEIVDPTGRVVWRKAHRAVVAGTRETIDLREGAAGIYVLTVNHAGKRSQHRFVVQGR